MAKKNKQIPLKKGKGWEYWLAITLSVVGVLAILLIVLKILNII